MIKNTTIFILATAFFIVSFSVKAQFENNKEFNNDGATIECYAPWINTAAGIYTGLNSAVFNHYSSPGQTFVNNGIYLASLGHKDAFKGTKTSDGPHEIGGTKRPGFFNVDFINGLSSIIAVTNTEGIAISGKLIFQNGITTTSRNLHQKGSIRFEPGSSFDNGNTDAQHVNGYVSKVGNTAFTFPVGNGSDLRTLQITAPTNATAHFSTAWIAGDPGSTADPSDASPFHSVSSVSGVLVKVSKTGQWDFVTPVAAVNQLIVKVSIPDVSAFSAATYLRLAGWNGTSWIDLSGAVTATGNTENSFLSGNIPAGSTISALAIGSIETALPVRLKSFTVQIIENTSAELKWVTVGEINNDYFEIEHSTDAKYFDSIGSIKGKGTVSETLSYTFNHKPDVAEGIHYYRIKQFDFDKSFAYSTMRSVDFGGLTSKVYPNPASHVIRIDVENRNTLKSVELLDISGRSLYHSENKNPVHTVSTANLASGNYIVRLKFMNGTIQNKKILVVK